MFKNSRLKIYPWANRAIVSFDTTGNWYPPTPKMNQVLVLGWCTTWFVIGSTWKTTRSSLLFHRLESHSRATSLCHFLCAHFSSWSLHSLWLITNLVDRLVVPTAAFSSCMHWNTSFVLCILSSFFFFFFKDRARMVRAALRGRTVFAWRAKAQL